VISSIVNDFQEEFQDFFYSRRRMLQKKIDAITEKHVIPFEYQAAPEAFSQEFTKLLNLTKIPIVYDMLFEGNVIEANITINDFRFDSGSQEKTVFRSFEYYTNYSINLPNQSLYFALFIPFDGNAETKAIKFRFGDLYYDEDIKNVFFVNTQFQQISSFYNQTLLPLWNASHFSLTPASDCKHAKDLQAKLTNMTLIKKYTYFCGVGKELEIAFNNAKLSNIVFHPNDELFNSITNVTFYGAIIGTKTTGSLVISSNVGLKKNVYKFTNNTLAYTHSSVASECLSVNPQLLDLIIFDFALDFRGKYVTPVQALRYLR